MHVEEYATHDATGLAELIKAGKVTAAEVHAAAVEALRAVLRAGRRRLGAVRRAARARRRRHLRRCPLRAEGPGVPRRGRAHPDGQPDHRPGRDDLRHDTELMSRFRRRAWRRWHHSLRRWATTPTPPPSTDHPQPVRCHSVRRRIEWRFGSPRRARGGTIAHANDGGGSIRIPAAYNGLVGLKPTRGRVPSARLPGRPVRVPVEFAVTRTVRDAAVLLDEVAGWAPGDKYRIQSPERPFARGDRVPRPLRIAVHTESWAGTRCRPEVTQPSRARPHALEEMGHHVERPPEFDWADFMLAHYRIWAGFVAESVHAIGQ